MTRGSANHSGMRQTHGTLNALSIWHLLFICPRCIQVHPGFSTDASTPTATATSGNRYWSYWHSWSRYASSRAVWQWVSLYIGAKIAFSRHQKKTGRPWRNLPLLKLEAHQTRRCSNMLLGLFSSIYGGTSALLLFLSTVTHNCRLKYGQFLVLWPLSCRRSTRLVSCTIIGVFIWPHTSSSISLQAPKYFDFSPLAYW